MELHDLIDLQKAILSEYNNNVWTTYGMYVLAIGWIMTSDKSRNFLLANPAVRWAVGVAAVLVLVIEIIVLFFLQQRSQSLYDYIIQTCDDWFKSCDKQRASKFIVLEIQHITIWFPIISSISAAILCSSFIVMIIFLKQPRHTVSQAAK